MARLSIGVERLGAEGFRLELGAGDASNVVALAPGGGIRGRYEQDEKVIGLRALRGDTLALAEFRWHFSNGHIELAAPSRLTEVEIDASIYRGDARPKFVGAIRAGSVHANLDVTLGNVTIHGASVELQSFELIADAAGAVAIRFGSIRAGTLRVRTTNIDLVASEVASSGACTIDAAGLRVDALEIGRVQVTIPDLTRESAAEPSSGPRRLPDLPLLDHLHGHVAIDVVPDVTLPIVGSRKATHAFRIPIEQGAITIDSLEDGLSTLESLVVDFAVKEGKLVLEKDIPLVPFDNKPLVEWPLDAAAQALADQRRVPIATLIRPVLPESARKEAEADRKKKGRAVELRRLDLANINVDLRCGGPSELALGGGTLRLGDAERPAFGKLAVTGNLSHAPGDPSKGGLSASASGIHASLQDVAMGTRTIAVGDIAVAAVDGVQVDFAGLRPQSLRALASNIVVRGVHLAAATSGAAT